MQYVNKMIHLTGGGGGYIQTLTDHHVEIEQALQHAHGAPDEMQVLAAVELLQCHDDTGISLDNWLPVRKFVEETLGFQILENRV